MRQIEFPGKGYNVEEVLRFAEDLRENFNPVRVRFYKADFRSADSPKPTHVFRADSGKANYAVMHINNRMAIEFYRRSNVKGHLYDENFSDETVRVVLNTLLKNRMRNIPAPAIKILPTAAPVQKPFYAAIFEGIGKFFSSIKSRL